MRSRDGIVWPKVSKEQWLDNESITDAQVLERCKGRCEKCGSRGDKLRPIMVHHKRHKGMGGTRHLYTPEEKEALCGHCHSVGGHNLREGDNKNGRH